jgi:hypothetical protein
MNKCIFKTITIIFIAFLTMNVSAKEINKENVIGQWRNVVKNPSHKNTVSKRYMRHTFFEDGKLIIEDKKDSQSKKKWKIVNNEIVVRSSYKKSKFIEHYNINDSNTLIKTKFKSIVDGKPMANYDPKEKYVKQGSNTESEMKILDIFKSVNKALDFIDPNTLEVGKKYKLSKKTPIMAHYTPTNLSTVFYLKKGNSIKILKQKLNRTVVWYQVEYGKKGSTAWVNSVALFGQELKN